ncbi:ATP-binding protein [Candidatus Woesearchaeota archaeon]|nr:ATP-binding protein [Candidatus Woesearchaeota archaeon]
MLDSSLLGKDPFDEILGQERTKQDLKSALLTGRHVLVIGPPGVGKTTLAKNAAKILPALELNNCDYHCAPDKPFCPKCLNGAAKRVSVPGIARFIRVQGSPDLTVEDLLGDIDPVKALQYGPTSEQAFTPGKIFKANKGLLFFDELNRCPEKVQNALLQVLEEGKATIGSHAVDIAADFIFIGTMNPEETAATEKLSDVLLDRFDVVHMGYPETSEVEQEIVRLKGAKLGVKYPDKLFTLMIEFVRSLRESPDLQKKPGVRATIGLYERSQANALLRKAKEVEVQDVIGSVISVLSHRIELKPSIKYLQSTETFLQKKIEEFSNHTGGGCL